MHVNRKWTFTFLSGGFAQIFSQIVSVRVKKKRGTNFISSRHVKREKASLLVDVRRSRTLKGLVKKYRGGGGGLPEQRGGGS